MTFFSTKPQPTPTVAHDALTESLSDVEAIESFGLDNSEYAQKCRQIMDLYNTLVDLGADKFLEIPQIVVIGGQSAGKSSLVEAVSKVKVPRDSGTCTRCAMQFTLARDVDPDAPWSCKIVLRYEYGANGKQLATSRIEEFVTLSRQKDVELNLRRAQLAILSGKQYDIAKIKGMSTNQLKWYYEQQKDGIPSFSKNTVVVTITAPDITELTFVDLPGLVSNASDEDVNIVRELVESKISRPKTVILVTIPMSEDMRRQEAVKMARKADPAGERTIGVLTKPDALREGDFGSREDYKRVLLGQDEHLAHGYFCVRLRNDEERKQNRDIGVLAKELFHGDPYWRTMQKEDRFGIENLVKYVSPLLVKLFEKSLPGMWKRVVKLVHDTQRSLDALGDSPKLDKAPEQLQMLILQFGFSLKNLVLGTDDRKMVQLNRQRYVKLRNEVLETCPRFDSISGMPTLSALPGSHGDIAKHIDASLNTFTLEDVKRIVEESTAWQLEGEVPLEATRALIQRFVTKWEKPIRSCFEDVFDNSLAAILGQASTGFRPGQRQVKALDDEVRRIVRNEMNTLKADVLVTVEKIITWENPKTPYTLSPEYATVRDDIVQRYRDAHRSPTVPEAELDVMAKVLAYFQVAYKRLIDTVPRAIERELHGDIHDRLTQALFRSIAEPGRAKELLKEDIRIGRQREDLRRKLDRLEEIRVQLQAFGCNDMVPDTSHAPPKNAPAPSSVSGKMAKKGPV